MKRSLSKDTPGRGGWALAVALLLGFGCEAVDENLLRSRPRGAPVAEDGGTLDAGRTPERPDASSGATGVPDASLYNDCNSSSELPTCTRPHALTACVEDACVLVECVAPWVDCDGDPDDGCEAVLESADNCGLCGTSCALPNADASCATGACEFLSCQPAFGDCDLDPGNGCETPLDSLLHCGTCGETCSALSNAAPGCVDGGCGVGQCLGPFGDCDGDAATGCEQRLDTDERNL